MQAALVELDSLETAILRKIVRSKTLGDSLKERSQIVLAASEGLTNRRSRRITASKSIASVSGGLVGTNFTSSGSSLIPSCDRKCR